jgi:hypothetical protein
MGRIFIANMQKTDQARVIYETLLNKRVSDSHWTKIKKLMVECDLPLDPQGFRVMAGLRSTCPRYFTLYSEIKDELTSFGREILPELSGGVTGEQFLSILKRRGINPDQSTVSRWFRSVGGFGRKIFYVKATILPVLATALIYEYRKRGGSRRVNSQMKSVS